MNILSLDMSSQKSGYSYFIKNKLQDYGVWEMPHDVEKDWRKRISWMASQLNQYCDEHQIDLILVEDVPPLIDNSQTVKVLSALQGCVLTLANIKNLEVEFISVAKWKKIIGIDLTHSKENNVYKKLCDKTVLSNYKKAIKSAEKRLSVDNANNLFKLALVWKSATSKYNQDDISDSLNIAASKIFGEKAKYDIMPLEDVIKDIYNQVNQPKERKGFGKQTLIERGG